MRKRRERENSSVTDSQQIFCPDVKNNLVVGLTSDSELGLITVTCVCNIFGHTAILPAVCMAHTSDL